MHPQAWSSDVTVAVVGAQLTNRPPWLAGRGRWLVRSQVAPAAAEEEARCGLAPRWPCPRAVSTSLH